MKQYDKYTLQMAIRLANNRLTELSNEDIRCYAFDRMVDELYDELIDREIEANGVSCNE